MKFEVSITSRQLEERISLWDGQLFTTTICRRQGNTETHTSPNTDVVLALKSANNNMGDEPPKRKRKAVRFEEEANESSRKATKRRRETSNGEPADATEANQLWWSSHEIKSLRKETLHERDSLQRAPKSAVYARALWLAYMAAGPNAELVAALECGLARGVESLLVPQLALERFALRRLSLIHI